MDHAKRLLIATLVSTAMLTVFLLVAGWLSPATWEANARVLTQLDEASIRARLVDRERWEALRGEATDWATSTEGTSASWSMVELELRPTEEGFDLVQRVGPAAVTGGFRIDDTGEQREVRMLLRGEVTGGPFNRLVLRFDKHRFQDRAQLELEGLLSEEGGDPEGSPPE